MSSFERLETKREHIKKKVEYNYMVFVLYRTMETFQFDLCIQAYFVIEALEQCALVVLIYTFSLRSITQ